MASEMSPQSIREVRFREKLRGYHPEDVDEFVANVAATVESLQRRLDELEGASSGAPRSDDAGAGGAGAAEVEESLRRTLILAQRTADMAVKEAQEEAARLIGEAEAARAEALGEVEELRARSMAQLEHELLSHRDRLHEERELLLRDVAALQAYVAQERERLRIYFSQQLQQVVDGVPGVAAPPAVEAPARASEEVVVADEPGLPEHVVEVASATDDAAQPTDDATEGEGEDDFLAELRRAVTDNEPLGPREEDDDDLPPRDTRDFDIFNQDDGGGRFLRRRR